MRIFRAFTFDAAHKLTEVPPGHKCARLHGHTFRVEVHVEGPVGDTTGWVVDFAEIKDRVGPVLEDLDHHYLNDIEGLENPTSENIARWMWTRLMTALPGMTRIVVMESPNTAAVYEGEGAENG